MVCVQIPPAPCSQSNLTDRYIVEGLAASEHVHRRLLRAAHRVRTLLFAGAEKEVVCLDLYGSLALSGATTRGSTNSEWWQDWVRHYVRAESDVDLVVQIQKDSDPEAVVRKLTGRGRFTLTGQTSLKKFCTTQYTLRGGIPGDGTKSSEVWLDITCIDSGPHFERFRCRQEAFRQAFRSARAQLEAAHGADGALAFDAYVYLVKSFASKVQGASLSGFQATCLGIFALQLHLYELRCCQPTGLILFECFLRFCCTFFSDSHTNQVMRMRSYQYCAIDLSLGGRLLPRFSSKWKCEVYFLGVEVQMQTKISERVNIAHSVVPEAVHVAAKKALSETCTVANGQCRWR